MQIIDLVFSIKNKIGLITLISLGLLLSACTSPENVFPITELFETLVNEQIQLGSSPTPLATTTPDLIATIPSSSAEIPAENAPYKPSPTPVSSLVPTPTITPRPNPTASSDLLYLTGDQLMRWDYVTQFASLLVDRVVAYASVVDEYANYQLPETVEKAVKKIQKKIVLLRSREITANGAALFDLDILDLETKQITNLLEKTAYLEAFQLTKQGDRLVYIQRGVDDQIFMVSMAGNSQPQHIADCIKEDDRSCAAAIWSPDGKSLVWSDPQGIWIAQVEELNTQLLQTNIISVTDPRGQESKSKVAFELHSWSPDGRFILVKIIPSAEGVQWYSLLDTRLARLVNIPESADYSTQSAKITWTYDGDLLVAHSSLPESEQAPYIQTWEIIPTNNTLLNAGQKIILNNSAFTGEQTSFSQVHLCPIWFQQLDPITFRLAIINPQGGGPANLYQLNIEKNILEAIMPIPAQTHQVIWSPDSSGALVLGEDGQTAFASILSNQLVDLSAIIGKDAHSFLWLSPAPRQ